MIIYKKTTTGKIQTWQQEINGNKYRTCSGQLDGKITTSEWTICYGKNLGKANETSGEEQAIKEVEANYKKKLTLGSYVTSLEDIDEPTYFKPMLAYKYQDCKHTLDFSESIFVQSKLDGLRCIATSKGLFSRKGEPITSVPHIFEELKPFFEHFPDTVLDGELYNHELMDDFNKICSLVKKKKPTQEDLQESKEKIQYWVYDVIVDKLMSYKDRISSFAFETSSIKRLPYFQVPSEQMIDSFLEKFLNEGYEGAMIRTNNPYENKRTKNLLKYKIKDSDEFIVLDILEGKGNWSGYAKKALLKKHDGTLFEASIAATQLLCKVWLQYKDFYIDKPATVEYHGLTPDGIPRFGVIKEFNREM